MPLCYCKTVGQSSQLPRSVFCHEQVTIGVQFLLNAEIPFSRRAGLLAERFLSF